MNSPPRARILVVFGTRPEAIKLFPLIHALKNESGIEVVTCVTAQHREMLDQVLRIGQVTPDHDLDLMAVGQTLDQLSARLLTELGALYDRVRPDRVVVQGDTATAMIGALAAYYRKIPVSHVEAGLRSGDIHHPWPEEVNRRIVACIADQHFAPTDTAAYALRAERIDPKTIHVTGNTVIDALHATRARIEQEPALAGRAIDLVERLRGQRIVTVTSHRRENFGEGMQAIARAVARIAAREGVAVVFPVHPNPSVRAPMQALLSDNPSVVLCDPLDYPEFVYLLAHSHFVLTDSGGVQEEAPAFGKPVLVMRDTTERPEGVAAGTARLIGASEDRIVEEAEQLLDDENRYAEMSRAHNPFGDGKACGRITRIIINGK